MSLLFPNTLLLEFKYLLLRKFDRLLVFLRLLINILNIPLIRRVSESRDDRSDSKWLWFVSKLLEESFLFSRCLVNVKVVFRLNGQLIPGEIDHLELAILGKALRQLKHLYTSYLTPADIELDQESST